MAAEADVLEELRLLRARVPQLTGALAAGVDGLVIAHDVPGIDPDGLAALTAAALGVALRLADATGRGGYREALVRGTRGYVATYAAGSTAVLTLVAPDRVNVGRLHLEGRRAGARIGELVDAAEAAAAVEAPPVLRARPARTPRTADPPTTPPTTPRTTKRPTTETTLES
jgi:predicted regulator of Ras-like GTPase activity (Roadblock/LC7/MglB family)